MASGISFRMVWPFNQIRSIKTLTSMTLHRTYHLRSPLGNWFLLLVSLAVLNSCQTEEICPNGSIERILRNDSLYWELYDLIDHRSYPFYFKLEDARDSSFNDTFMINGYRRWQRRTMLVFNKDACNKVLLDRRLKTMYVSRMHSWHKFYLIDSDPLIEDFPELFILYNYRGVLDSGYFSVPTPLPTKTITSSSNPNLHIRFHPDSGIVHMENTGLFKLTRFND